MKADSRSLASVHAGARRTLEAAGLPEAALDARILVEAITGTSRADVVTSPDREVAEDIAVDVARAVRRRLSGEPVHRIIGRREFYGIELRLAPETLEPRPDTETLVDLVLPALRDTVARRGVARVLDLGTGSGAIALALLREAPGSFATGTDIAPGALHAAAANAAQLGLAGRFSTVQSDWFSSVEGRFDIIVSNPPYIATGEIEALAAEVRLHDPLAALDGGADGLDAYRSLAAGARSHLSGDGIVAVEIGHLQRQAAIAIFSHNGFALTGERKDLGGRDRALIFRPSSA